MHGMRLPSCYLLYPKNRELENKYFGRWGFIYFFIIFFLENRGFNCLLGSFAFY